MRDTETLVLVLVMLVNIFLVSTVRLKAVIQAAAAQGALLGLMPAIISGEFSTETLLIAVACIFIKGITIPALLLKAMREVHVTHDIEPLVGFLTTIMVLSMGTGISLSLTGTLPLLESHRHSLIVPASLSTLLTGVILLVTRKKAITQVIGFLSLENGVFTFGLLLLHAVPVLVELGVLLDLFVAIFVMAIIINQVRRTFSSLDTYHLSSLKE